MIVKLGRTIITKCNGCGIDLQTKDIKIPGFILETKLAHHFECRKNYTSSIGELLKGQIHKKKLHIPKVNTVQDIEEIENNTTTIKDIAKHEKIIKKRNIYCQRCSQLREQPLFDGIEEEMKILKKIDTDATINSIFSNIKPRSIVLYIVVLILPGHCRL